MKIPCLLAIGMLTVAMSPADPALGTERHDRHGDSDSWQTSWDAFLTIVEQELNRHPQNAAGLWEGKEVNWEGTVRQIQMIEDRNLRMLIFDMPRRTLSIKDRAVIAQTVVMFVPMKHEQEQAWTLKKGDRVRFKTTIARNRTLTFQESDAKDGVSVMTVKGQAVLLVFSKGGTISK